MKQVFSCLILLTLAAGTPLLSQRVQVTGPEGGDVRSLAVHPERPGRFFLGTADGRLFVSTDSGRSWRALQPGLGSQGVVDNLVFDPSDPDTLYAATWELKSDRGRLFRSRDGGLHWRGVSTGRFKSAIRAIAIAPSDPSTIALGITEGVLLSRDGGRSWDRITRGYRSLYHVESLAFDPSDARTLYVGTWHLGWKTSNLGKKWIPIHSGMISDSDLFSFIVDPHDPSVLYSSACTGVYKSTDAGKRWSKLRRGLPKAARRTRTLYLDPRDPRRLLAGTTEGLFLSRDAGHSWQRLFSQHVVNAVVLDPSHPGVILAGTDDAGILRSEDGGEHFVPSNRGFVHRQVPVVVSKPGEARVLYAAVAMDGEQGGFFTSRDSGHHWSPYNPGLGRAVSEIRVILPFAGKRTVLLGTASGIYSGTPFRQPWKLVQGTRHWSVQSMILLDGSRPELMVATLGGLYLLNLQEGRSRHLEDTPFTRARTLMQDPESGLVLAGESAGVFASSDRGRSWLRRSRGLPPTGIKALRQWGDRYLCATERGLFYSRDEGRHWIPLAGLEGIDIGVVEPQPGTLDLVAAESQGGRLLQISAEGRRWFPLSLGDHRSPILSLAFGPRGEILAGTSSAGIYRITPPREAGDPGLRTGQP